MSSSDRNLKSQLSDIQKRLAETKFSTPKRANSRKDAESPAEVSPSSNEQTGPLKTFPLVSRRDKRVSLPALDNSRSLSSPAKGTGKDMDFVVGLSENLLQECRRLQAENQSKTHKLSTLEDEFHKLKASNANLLNKLNDTKENEEKHKDSSWELEMKLQQLMEEHKSVSENYQKSQKELSKYIDISSQIRSELEEVNLNKVSLEKEVSSTRMTSSGEILELKSHVDDLNEVNTRLNDEIDGLREQLQQIKSKPTNTQLTQIPVLQQVMDSDSEDDLQEPPVSPVKTVALNNSALESETLKASLQNAHQTIAKLRGQILKLRQNEISSKQLNQTPSPKKATPMKKLAKNFNESMRGLQIKGTSNRGSTVVFDESMTSSDPDDSWENYEGQAFVNSPSKRSSRPLSVVSGNRDLIEDSDSDEDIENFPVAPLSSELHTIVSEDDVKQYVQERGLVLIPQHEFTLLTESSKGLIVKEQQVRLLTQKLSQRDIAEQRYVKDADEYRQKLESTLEDLKNVNANVIELKSQVDTPSEDFIYSKASEKSLTVLPSALHSKLVQDAETTKVRLRSLSLDHSELQKKLEDTSLEYNSALEKISQLTTAHEESIGQIKSLHAQLESPSSDYIKSKSSALGLVTMASAAMAMTAKAAESRLSGALSELSALREKHASATAEAQDKARQLETLQSEHQIATSVLAANVALLGSTQAQHMSSQEKLNSLVRAHGIVESDLDAAQREKLSLKASQFALKEDYDLLRDTHNSLKADHDSLRDIHNSLKTSHESLKNGYAALEFEHNSVEDALVSLKSEHETLNNTHKTLMSDHSALQTQIESSQQLHKEVTESLESLRAELVSKSSEIAALKNQLAETLAESEKNTQALKNDLSSTQEQLKEKTIISEQVTNDLKTKLAGAESKHNDIHTSLVESQQSLEKCTHEIVSLKDQLENPQSDFLTEKASKQGLSLIPKTVHVSLIEKANKTIDDLAKEGDYVVLKSSDHKDLSDKALSPTIDYLTAGAEKHGYSVIDSEELNALTTRARKSTEVLAKENNLVAVPQAEHQELLRKLKNPTRDEIELSSKAIGLVVVPEAEYRAIVERADKPSVEGLTRNASALGLTVITIDQATSLNRASSQLSEELENGKSLNSDIALLKEESSKKDAYIEDLTTALNEKEEHLKREPTLPKESLLKQIGALGLVTLSTSEDKKLREPTKDDLVKHATAHGLALIPVPELSEIKARSLKSIDEMARDQKKVVLTNDDHQKLLNPTKDVVEQYAEAHGFIIYGKQAFNELKQNSEKTVDQLAKEANLVLLPVEEHNRLVTPTIDDLRSHAESHDSVVLSKKSFEDLTSRSNRTAHDLAKESDLVLLSHADHDSLLKPSSDTVVKLATGLGLSAIAAEELESLKSATEKPTVDFLKKKADELNMSLVEKNLCTEMMANYNKSIEDLAKENNLVLVTNDRYRELLNPSAEKLQDHAASIDHVIVSKEEFIKKRDIETLNVEEITTRLGDLGFFAVSKDKYDQLVAAPELDTVKSQAEDFGFIVIGKDEFKKISEPDQNMLLQLCEKRNLHAIDKEEYHKLSEPDQNTILQLCENHNLHAIEKESFEKLGSEAYIVERANNLGYATLPLEELHALKARAEDPDRVTLEAQAAKFGLAIVGQKEYDAYERSLSKVSKADLEVKALRINHTLIPTLELEELRTFARPSLDPPATPTSKFHATKEYFENVHSAEKESPKAKVFESAKALGFVPVAADEYKNLLEHQKDHVITKSDIYTSAKEFQLTVLPSAEYKTLLKSRQRDGVTLEELQLYAKQFDLRLVDDLGHDRVTEPGRASESSPMEKPRGLFMGVNPSLSTLSSAVNESDFTDALSRQPSNASTIHAAEAAIGAMNSEELRLQASQHGFKLVALGDLNHAPEPENDSDSNDGDNETDEEDTKHDTLVLMESPVVFTKETVSTHAAELGLVVMEQSEYSHLTSEIGKIELEEKAKNMGLRVVDESEFVSVHQPEEKQVRELCAKLGLVTLTEPELKSVEEKAIIGVTPDQVVNESNIVELGSNLGYKVVSNAEYGQLIEQSKPVAMTKQKLVLAAGLLGLVAVDSDEFSQLKKDATVSKDRSKGTVIASASTAVGTAGAASIATIAVNANNLADKPFSRSDVVKKAEELGLFAVSKEELEEIKNNAAMEMTHDPSYVTSILEQRNLVAVSTQHLQSLQQRPESIPTLTKSEIIEKAMEFDLVTVSKEELDELREKAALDRTSSQDIPILPPLIEVSSDHFETWARQHDLLLIPEQAFVATNVSRIPDPQNVVVLPTTYYNKLTKSESLNLDKLSNEELQAQAKKRGFQVLYESTALQRPLSPPLPSATLTRKSSHTSLTSSQSRKNLVDLAKTAALEELDYNARVSRATSTVSHSRASSRNNRREMSIDGGLSLATHASLSEPNIIPALTQTVIGEYLHKYYRRLGPFSSISETRHERYFWIHPYTLTLYWSTANPVLGNPSQHRTRAAAILGVESLEDNNPLPAGVYHKSIVVHSQSRSVKFTCPTRQRHNIWYNSLRYLLQRSMEGIDLEDLDASNVR